VTLLWAVGVALVFFVGVIVGSGGSEVHSTDIWQWKAVPVLVLLPLATAAALFVCVALGRRGWARAVSVSGVAATAMLARLLFAGELWRFGSESRIVLLLGVTTAVGAVLVMPRSVAVPA
jgi:hypothetical protein